MEVVETRRQQGVYACLKSGSKVIDADFMLLKEIYANFFCKQYTQCNFEPKVCSKWPDAHNLPHNLSATGQLQWVPKCDTLTGKAMHILYSRTFNTPMRTCTYIPASARSGIHQ